MNDKKYCNDFSKNKFFSAKHHMNAFIGIIFFSLFAVFLAGYFLGKNYVIKSFIVKAEHDSFADQIYTSLCALSNENGHCLAKDDAHENINPIVSEKIEKVEIVSPLIFPQSTNKEVDGKKHASWYAALIGYHTKNAAVSFGNKLKKKGIPVNVQEYSGATHKNGKKNSWYQVVTKKYDDKKILSDLVKKIAHEERLGDVKIYEC